MFEIFSPTLPRFFLSSWCSGVQTISLSLNGAQEVSPAPGEGVVVCPTASFTYTFDSGYVVTLSGPLRVHVLVVPHTAPPQPDGAEVLHTPPHKLQFSFFEFTSKKVTKSLAIHAIKGNRILYTTPSMEGSSPAGTIAGHVSPSDVAAGAMGASSALDGNGSSVSSGASTSPTLVNGMPEPVVVVERATMPPDPVNEFGITQCTMRVLELAESMDYLSDLIHLAWDPNMGPLQALQEYGIRMRAQENGVALMPPAPPGNEQTPPDMKGMASLAGGMMTQSPGLMHVSIPPGQQHSQQQSMPPQQLGGASHTLMGPPPPPMMNGGMYPQPRQPSNSQATPNMGHAQPQNPHQMLASPGGRPPSSVAGSIIQQRPPSSAGQGSSGSFNMPSPSHLAGPSGKRKATVDGAAPGDASPDMGPPTRRQRTSGSVPNAGVTFVEGAGAANPEPAKDAQTRATRGRKSPLQSKSQAPPSRAKGRRGTNT